jgi:hypothetical protein
MLVEEVEDVDGASCAVDDMKKVEVLTNDDLAFRVESGRREWTSMEGGREKRGLGYKVMGGLQDTDGAGARL